MPTKRAGKTWRVLARGGAATLALLLSACGGSTDAASVVTTDSAGVRIVTHSAAAMQSTPTVRIGEEVVRIGMLEGPPEYTFQAISGAMQLGNGNVFVVDGRAGDMRVYSGRGEYLTTVGRRGGGPDDFRSSPQIRPFGEDRVIAWDGGTCLLVYSPEGALDRTIGLADSPGFGSWFLGMDPEGGAIFRALGDHHQLRRRADGEMRDTASIIRYAPGGGERSLHLRLAAEDQFVSRSGREVASLPVIFSRPLIIQVSSTGLLTGDADQLEVQTRGADGETIQIVRVSTGISYTPTDADIEFGRATMTAAFNRRSSGRTSDHAFRDAPVRNRIPAVQTLLIDAGGRVWLRQYPRVGDAGQAWLTVDRDGALLGRVLLPFEVEPLSIGSKHLVGVVRDEWDVEYLVLHRLPRPLLE